MSRSKKIKTHLPRWVAVMYTIFAVVLVPWTVYLAYSLPTKHTEKHWDVTWVGLDIAIILLLLLTGFLASLKSRIIIITLSATASFLLVDAWFDIISSRPGEELIQSILLAVFIEIPLSILGFRLAYKTINKNIN